VAKASKASKASKVTTAAVGAFPFGSAAQLARAVRSGKIGAVELLKAYLERVDRLNPAINAVVVDDREAAMKQARAADRALAKGEKIGPLHGVPITVKESFNLVGTPTTWGYTELAGNIATTDAVVVQRLRAAGAVIFGKTNVPVSLADFQSYNAVYGTTNNPWDHSRVPGGSSGGSAAATAAGLSGLEYGSDIGGSIRTPAAYCGVYGHKPTFGIVPKRGQTVDESFISEGDISVVGPIARSADDLELALAVTAGPDELLAPGWKLQLPKAPASLEGLRVAVWTDQPDLSPVDEEVRIRIEAAAAALRKAGAKVNHTARPDFDPAAAHETYQRMLMALMAPPGAAYYEMVAKAAALDPADASQYAQQLRWSTMSLRDFTITANRREHLRWAWKRFFADFDVLLAPITPTAAFPHDQSEPMGLRTLVVDGREVPYFAQLFWAGLAIASYLPATSTPIGRTASGLPVGMQIIGAEMADRTTIWTAGRLARLIGGFSPPPGY
jgi:amidase